MMCAASYVASSRERAVMLFPNQSLAIQMFADFKEAFPAISSQLVITDTDTKLDLRSFNVLIGTTALLHRDVGDFALCITDEEQKLSVNMKEQLVGKDAHMLIASATPIPRTTALAQHGGVEILKLTKCHAKKEFVTTISCAGDERVMTDNAKSVIAAGGKVLIVCPKRVTEDADNKDELPSAETIGNKWKKLLPGLVRIAHSGLKNSENEQSINDVKTGEAKMLVATSVVEVGLNIPNLWMVIVVDAKRFGLSVIHQIRGRLIRQGENNGVGYCVLYCPGPIKEKTRDRLTVLVNVQDGYEIAREDMFLRGLGDISDRGKSQHGSADAMCIGKEVSLVIIEEILGLFEEESNNQKIN
jgi:ATP-dependent DNA helicase RecG